HEGELAPEGQQLRAGGALEGAAGAGHGAGGLEEVRGGGGAAAALSGARGVGQVHRDDLPRAPRQGGEPAVGGLGREGHHAPRWRRCSCGTSESVYDVHHCDNRHRRRRRATGRRRPRPESTAAEPCEELRDRSASSAAPSATPSAAPSADHRTYTVRVPGRGARSRSGGRKGRTMQFHHHGYVSTEPRVAPAAGTGLDQPEELPETMDVLIVGSGPAGVIAAAQLAQYPEVSTRIIERRPGRLELGQADGIQARSVETFQAFGFAERIIAEAYRITEMNFWGPDPENPRHIIRTSRTDDDIRGVSEFPHLIVNQARV